MLYCAPSRVINIWREIVKNTAMYNMVVWSLLVIFCGCSESTDIISNTVPDPTDTTNLSQLISFDSLGTPTANSVYLEKISRDRKSTRLNSSHIPLSRMPSSA